MDALDEKIAWLKTVIERRQRELETLLAQKAELIERENQRLRELTKRKPSPLKGRQFLDDSECAVSTFIKRRGGVKIPDDLKEEFGGWNRLHAKRGLAVDEMAEELYEYGLIERPDTNALLDGLKSGRKSARVAREPIDWRDLRPAPKRELPEECPF